MIRGAAGSLFRMPFVQAPLLSAIELLRSRGFRVFATSSHHATTLSKADLTGRVALLVGNEGAGVPRELIRAADGTIAVPHSPRVESLNAGVAASIVLYEIARQNGYDGIAAAPNSRHPYVVHDGQTETRKISE